MKTIHHFLLIACLSAGMPDPGRGTDARRSHQRTAQRAGHDHPSEHRSTAARTSRRPEAATNAAATPRTGAGSGLATNAVAGTNAASDQCVAASTAAPPVVVENGTDGLRLNFHDAPLSLVLDYLSDAAGFVINKETDVRGTVDVQGKRS